ncbi:hypothetical protein HHJ78_10865 [Mobiluncus mulieris]|uniref:Head-to-tail stopper n=1 Tax=Mobiluncus mulieris TaxID=2052 RepID=A0A7Y0U328_9ACTO|nr:hypothetical protein [Mobiluncus mulieris]NMW65985.1 hypothetical protein [Mobiluncus mulieris]
MLEIAGSEPICFNHPERFERLRPGVEPDPYDPDAAGVPTWDKPDILVFEGFLTESTSTITPDAVRGQVATSGVLTVADPNVDIQVGDRIRQGDRLWQVTGRPAKDKNPFTGWQPTLEATVAQYEG